MQCLSDQISSGVIVILFRGSPLSDSPKGGFDTTILLDIHVLLYIVYVTTEQYVDILILLFIDVTQSLFDAEF